MRNNNTTTTQQQQQQQQHMFKFPISYTLLLDCITILFFFKTLTPHTSHLSSFHLNSTNNNNSAIILMNRHPD